MLWPRQTAADRNVPTFGQIREAADPRIM